MLGLWCFVVNTVALAESAEESAAAVDTATESAEAISPVPTPVEATRKPAASSLFSADKRVKTAAGNGLVMADPVTVIGGLLLVLLLIVVIGWVIRRMGGMTSLGGQSMKIIAALSVGSREKVLLIEVGDKQILLGVAPGRVSCLQTFETPVIDSNTPVAGDFASTIKHLLKERVGTSDAAKRTEQP